MLKHSIWIGWDPREEGPFAVTRYSCKRYLTRPIPINGLVLSDLVSLGLYRRPFEYRKSAVDRPIMWDTISDAPQSTQHANSRFLVPYLAQDGWALFCDGDMLFRSNVARLFDELDPKYALYCVKHKQKIKSSIKMDGQAQMDYGRKNWSSFMVFNCNHEANKPVVCNTEIANMLPGRDLHRFCWLDDSEIGELNPEWNFLVGHSDPEINPKVVHFTEGCPNMPGYEDVDYAKEWMTSLEKWAA